MGKVITIVGMGPGVSLAVAKRFGQEGFAVGALARRADALEEQVRVLNAAGIWAAGRAADSGDPASLLSAMGQLTAELGDTDVLVYNAAGVRFKPPAELSAEEFNADLRVSIGGALAASQAVLPSMRHRGAGTILFTGDGFAFEPMYGCRPAAVG